jgi:hypothetical protein
MNRATAKMRDFAERLIAHEAGGRKKSDGENSAAFAVCEQLRPHLATLMGTVGFRTLLSRALTLATGQVPWLSGVQVKADGTLGGWEELRLQLAPEEMAEGRVALLAQLLGLLVAFIGETMTVRLVREVWPQLPCNDSESGREDKL